MKSQRNTRLTLMSFKMLTFISRVGLLAFTLGRFSGANGSKITLGNFKDTNSINVNDSTTDIVSVTKSNLNSTKSEMDIIYDSLKIHKIIPDVLEPGTPLPQLHLQVTYGVRIVRYGTELYSLQIENQPFVGFKGDKKALYTLIAVGPDMPSYADHDERNWLHWCVGNIPGGNVSRGVIVTPYDGLNLGYELGPHRIVFLVYRQPGKKKIKFIESDFSDKLDFFRRGFYNPEVFVERYNLTGPIAVNFLIGLWENEIHQAGSIYQ